ncbi:hypothetical protein BC830DRAFT_1116601 [Chytriomyces sp. MP71]|nr:hypothetical protein BC830DRAFT_1116601 [Chytriomyces sp. MP71]
MTVLVFCSHAHMCHTLFLLFCTIAVANMAYAIAVCHANEYGRFPANVVLVPNESLPAWLPKDGFQRESLP